MEFSLKYRSRRDFLLISGILGLSSLLSANELLKVVKTSELTQPQFWGPLFNKITLLLDDVASARITSNRLVQELTKLYNEFDLSGDYQKWIKPSNVANSKDVIFKYKNADAKLFLIEPGFAHPPHGHHDFASVEHVLKGTVSLQTYDRVAVLDNNRFRIKNTGATLLREGDSFPMTESWDNVHWFGAPSEPAVMLVTTVFDLHDTTKHTQPLQRGRIYVDPQGAVDSDGSIIAKILSKPEAMEKFAQRPPLVSKSEHISKI